MAGVEVGDMGSGDGHDLFIGKLDQKYTIVGV